MISLVTSSLGPICLAPKLPPKQRKVHRLELAGIEQYIDPVKAHPLHPQDHSVSATPQNQEVKSLEYRVRKCLENNWKESPCICKPKDS